ncbi:hypothetical protein B0G80_7102 [Paraburkholderia sp. BL6669N2]|nr:hypothetical protein B0G80_7102 [Paraburkholderia sp. BL6669N2]
MTVTGSSPPVASSITKSCGNARRHYTFQRANFGGFGDFVDRYAPMPLLSLSVRASSSRRPRVSRLGHAPRGSRSSGTSTGATGAVWLGRFAARRFVASGMTGRGVPTSMYRWNLSIDKSIIDDFNVTNDGREPALQTTWQTPNDRWSDCGDSSKGGCRAVKRHGQIAHREQRLRLAQHDSWEDLEAAFLRGLVPVERAASVRSIARDDRPGHSGRRSKSARARKTCLAGAAPPSHPRANP